MKSVKLAQRTLVSSDLSKIRQCNNKQEAQLALEEFCEKWGSNSKCIRMCKQLLNNKYLLTLQDVPEQKSEYLFNQRNRILNEEIKDRIQRLGMILKHDPTSQYNKLKLNRSNILIVVIFITN